MSSMWMVRAGEGAYAIEDYRVKSVVGIGWSDNHTDWTQFPDRDAIQAQIGKESPDNTETQNRVSASQIFRFLSELAVNDRVISYDPEVRRYLVGTITAAPKFQPGLIEGIETFRAVKWESTEVNRDDLSAPTRNSLGAISTLFRVPDTAAAEIEARLQGMPMAMAAVEAAELINETDVLRDVQSKSHEFIKDKISQLDWEQMQRLVAGLLRAMGYKTRVSAPGADRGKDIVASPDGLGFESPRIVVEVKHRKGAMGSTEIRSFVGGRHKDDKGLYVSTGGFTKDALYEAERSSIPLTLMGLDDLAVAVTENYEKMDAETRALLPLIRIYWPA